MSDDKIELLQKQLIDEIKYSKGLEKRIEELEKKFNECEFVPLVLLNGIESEINDRLNEHLKKVFELDNHILCHPTKEEYINCIKQSLENEKKIQELSTKIEALENKINSHWDYTCLVGNRTEALEKKVKELSELLPKKIEIIKESLKKKIDQLIEKRDKEHINEHIELSEKIEKYKKDFISDIIDEQSKLESVIQEHLRWHSPDEVFENKGTLQPSKLLEQLGTFEAEDNKGWYIIGSKRWRYMNPKVMDYINREKGNLISEFVKDLKTSLKESREIDKSIKSNSLYESIEELINFYEKWQKELRDKK